MEKKIKHVLPVRQDKLIVVLNALERKTKWETGIKNINGGFARAELKGFDKEYLDIELRYGVQSDVDDRVHVEHYKIEISSFNTSSVIDILANMRDA